MKHFFVVRVYQSKAVCMREVCAPETCSGEMVARYIAPLFAAEGFDPTDTQAWLRLETEVWAFCFFDISKR